MQEKRSTVRRESDVSMNDLRDKIKSMEREEIAIMVRLDKLEKSMSILDHRVENIENLVERSSTDISELLTIYRNSKGAVWAFRILIAIGTPLFFLWLWLKSHVTIN